MQASDRGLWALELGSNKMHPALLVLQTHSYIHFLFDLVIQVTLRL